MSQNFKVVQCLYTPSSIYCIHDYTKIAYLIGHYLCIREIVAEDLKPIFYQIVPSPIIINDQQYRIGMFSYSNLLILLTPTLSGDINIEYFKPNERNQLRIGSQLAHKNYEQSKLQYKAFKSQKYIYIIVIKQNDSQVIAVKINDFQVMGRGFIQGQIQKLQVIENGSDLGFTIVLNELNKITQYRWIQTKQSNKMKLIQKYQYNIGQFINHCYVDGEVIIAYKNNITIMQENRTNQNISVSGCQNVLSISLGFVLLTNHKLKIYRKGTISYELKKQFQLQQPLEYPLLFSPQQDIISYYSYAKKSINYIIKWDLIEQKQHFKLQFQQISHPNDKSVKIYSSNHAMMVLTYAHYLSIYSSYSYNSYLKASISVHQTTTQSMKVIRTHSLPFHKQKQNDPIQTVAIHPNRAIIAVSVRNLVRIYMVLYNELRMIKDIQISNCAQLVFNNSGNILCVRVGNRNGSKMYLFNSLKNYEQIQVLSTTKQVRSLFWNNLDQFLIIVHSNGYNTWSLQSLFKNKYQSHNYSFQLFGGLAYGKQILIWGKKQIKIISMENQQVQSYKLQLSINNLFVQNQQIIILTQTSYLLRAKKIALIQGLSQNNGFKVQQNSKIYKVKQNTILVLSKNSDVLCLQWGNEETNQDIIMIDRKKMIKYQQKYIDYQNKIIQIQQNLKNQLQNLKQQFTQQSSKLAHGFKIQIAQWRNRYQQIRKQKLKIEEMMELNMQAHQNQAMQQIKQLQRIYERKIAITTNKLLTSEQMGFRNNILAKQQLASLQIKHAQNIQQIRQKYSDAVKRNFASQNSRDDILKLKQQYQSRIAELQIQNEQLLKHYQISTQDNLINLKKNIVNLELKYTEAVSQKYNLQKSFQNQRIVLEQVRAKNDYLSQKLQQQTRRNDQLKKQNQNIQKIVIQKDTLISKLQGRIKDLQKSNQIFKYRIVEIKGISDPKQQQIIKLKQTIIQIQEEYQKISKKAYEQQQTLSLVKKDNIQLKNKLSISQNKQQKIDKNYGILIDKLRQTTKMPIQEIRKALIKLLQGVERHGEPTLQKGAQGSLAQLNRVRQHLQICLRQAVDSGKKNEKQKDFQINKKNRQNSQLLKQINDLRVRVCQLQGKLKQRQLLIQQFNREARTSSLKGRRQRTSTNFETQGRNQSRQQFFQKSLFKGHWKQKRLKTEQGTRKKSVNSFTKQDTNLLYIQNKGDEVEDLRRILQQKQTIIKQLINKIQKLS